MTRQRIAELLDRYIERTLTVDESNELKNLLKTDTEAGREVVDYFVETGGIVHAIQQVEKEEAVDGRATWHRFWLMPLAAVAGLVIMAGAGWMAFRMMDKGQVVARAEEVSGFSVQVSGKDLKAGDEICEGAKIETGDNGKVKFSYLEEGTTIELNEKSRLVVGKAVPRVGSPAGASFAKTLKLEAGRLVATVDPQPADAPMVISTPHAEMTVAGTKLSISAYVDRTRLLVEEGKVRMRAAGAAGEQEVVSGGVAVVRQGGKDVMRSGKICRTLDVKPWGLGIPQGLAFDGKLLWIYMLESATLVAVNPDTLKIEKQVKTEKPFPENSSGASGLAWDGKALWGWGAPGLLRAVDPETGKTVRELKVSGANASIPFDIQDGVLWTCSGGIGQKDILRIDMQSGSIISQTRIFQDGLADSMSCGRGIVFVTGRRRGDTMVYSPDDGRSLYTYKVDYSFFGGDAAYDSGRGLWCGSITTKIVLVETE